MIYLITLTGTYILLMLLHILHSCGTLMLLCLVAYCLRCSYARYMVTVR